MKNMKMKRIIAGMIDLWILAYSCGIIALSCNFLLSFLESISYYLYSVCSKILFFAIPVIAVMIETIVFRGNTIGKKIVGIQIVQLHYNNKFLYLFIRRLITVIMYPISFITILLFNITFSDILLNTRICELKKSYK